MRQWIAIGAAVGMVAVSLPFLRKQDDKIAGTAKSRFGSGQQKWTLSVNPETQKKFKNGPATASGMVCAYGDAVSVIQWEEQIDLQKAD